MAYKWLINGGDPNHLLNGMILQVGAWLPKDPIQICQKDQIHSFANFQPSSVDFLSATLDQLHLYHLARWTLVMSTLR